MARMTVVRLAGLLAAVCLAIGDEDDGRDGFLTISEKTIVEHLAILAAPELEGRDSPSLGLSRAADYIEACVREYETLKRRQTYLIKALRIIARVFVRVDIKNEFPTLPADEPFILMSNHYDDGDIFGVAEALRLTDRSLPIRVLAHEDFFARWYTRGILEYFGFIPARYCPGEASGG